MSTFLSKTRPTDRQFRRGRERRCDDHGAVARQSQSHLHCRSMATKADSTGSRSSPTVSSSAALARNDSREKSRSPPCRRSIQCGCPAGHPEGYVDAFRNVIAESWRAMRGEKVVYPSFADGSRGLALVEAAVESARKTSTVKIRS